MNASIQKLISLAGLIGSLLFASCAPAEEVDVIRPEWPESIIELASSLPVQDGGRIKPFQTYAKFALLPLNGMRKVIFADKERMQATEWLLNTIVFPEYADDYEVFQVRDSAIIDEIGLSRAGKKKSDRYSFNELRPGIGRLFQLADQYGRIEQKERDSIQQQIVLLASNVDRYNALRGTLDFARFSHPLGDLADNPRIQAILGTADSVDYPTILANLKAFVRVLDEMQSGGEAVAAESLQEILREADESASVTARLAAMFPPKTSVEEQQAWLTPNEIFDMALDPQREVADEYIATLQGLQRLVASRDDFVAFEDELKVVHATLTGLADARGQYKKIPLELHYYARNYVGNSHVLFVLSFLLMAFMWLMPSSKFLYRGTMLAVLAGMFCLIAAIVLRCVIRSRPPVSTLYETILFVTAGWTLVSVISEFINKKRVMLSAAAILGMLGLFLANRYELVDKQDTMPSLVAVLRTNFWLATHVTAITTGYSAGLLAALIASLYLLGKLFGVKKGDNEFYRNVARMSYGVLCFALIFSLVGTILGGVWANDSWGRFWGWDPKENGALLIVLSQIAILHARLCGYLRQHSLQMAIAFAGTVIAFSWFGVNLLGVGLHSYGFTSGISQALWTYYYIQWGIVAAGGVVLWKERSVAAALRAKATSGQLPD